MAMLYVVQNYAAGAETAPLGSGPGQLTSATLYTQIQIVPATSSMLKVIEWSISFNAAVLAAAFPVDLVMTGTVAATVTAYGTADVMVYGGDSAAPANTSGTSGIPLNLGTALSGFLSSSEGSITANSVFDAQYIDPVAGYTKQFPLGREPTVKPGNVLRVRVKGDGTTRCTAQVIFET